MTKREKLTAFESTIYNLNGLAQHDLRKLQTLNFRHGSGFRFSNPYDLIMDIFENCINSTIRKEALETYTSYIRHSSVYGVCDAFLMEYDTSYKSIEGEHKDANQGK